MKSNNFSAWTHGCRDFFDKVLLKLGKRVTFMRLVVFLTSRTSVHIPVVLMPTKVVITDADV